jgi:uncharacterized integral membrane protein
MVTATQNDPDAPTPEPTTTGPGAESTPSAPVKVPRTRTGGVPRTRTGGVPRTRMGGVWVTLLVAAFVLLLLLIFILQNGQRAQVSFLGAHGNLPMGVALLLAAVFGVLLVALPGTARIIQLRMLDRRRRSDTTPAVRPPASAPDNPEGR